MDHHDESVAVREGRSVRSTPREARRRASAWTLGPSNPPLDDFTGTIDDGQSRIADNVILGYD